MRNLNIDAKIFSEYIISFIKETNNFNANVNNKKLSNIRLQKMLYFIYVYALIKWDTKLWDDKFENWKYGPVIPEIYQQYVKADKNLIETNNKVDNLSMLTNFEKLELQSLILELNNFSDKELSEKSHASPWKKVEKKQEIKDQDIIDHYSKPDTFINKLISDNSFKSDFKFLS